MKTVILLASLIFLSACGDESNGYIEPEFRPYIERFQQEAKDRGINLDLTKLSVLYLEKVEQTDHGLAFGQCTGTEIRILRSFWEQGSETNKEVLLYHELGHCALGRGHTGGWNNELDIPKSVMVPSSDIVQPYWDHNRDYYIDELFSGRSQ